VKRFLAVMASVLILGSVTSPVHASPGVTSGVAEQAAVQHLVYDINTGRLSQAVSYQAALQTADQLGYGVAVFYDALGYNHRTGSTLTISAPRDCTPTLSDKDHRQFQMPNGWNDRVSSITTQMGNGTHCDVWFSSDIWFVGECGDRWIHMQADLRLDGCQNRASSYELS
jgi:hypothetical protein